jgi:L-asparaginase II
VSGDYQPVFETTRGRIVESVHHGAAAVVDASGSLLASLGNPDVVTFLRSSAKPMQALPFIESGGDQFFHLTSKEIAILCGSHSGTDAHMEVLTGIQSKAGVQESDLLCGVHPLTHPPTVEAMRLRGEMPTQNRHNCSGKHSGMLAFARMRGQPISDYLNPGHPVQRSIVETFAALCGLPVDEIEMGIDGCSAPNFAVPLRNAARALAILCDPRGLPAGRASACRRITQSMMAFPDMVAGPGRFDTLLMEICKGKLISKAGAEGYQVLGIMPGVLSPDSNGVGIAIKIADGDLSIQKADGSTYNRARPAVALEVLRQLGALSAKELAALEEFGPIKPITNWRKVVVGELRPAFSLHKPGTGA